MAKSHTAADAYILGRLGVLPRATHPTLDSIQPLAEAIRAMGALGAAKLFGRNATFAQVPTARCAETLSAGLDLLSSWPQGFKDLLGDTPAPVGKYTSSAEKFYGPIYFWTASLADDQFGQSAKSVLAEIHSKKRGAIKARSFLAKYICQQARSLSDAQRELEITYRSVRLYAEAFGLVMPHTKSGHIVLIPDDIFEKIKIGLSNSITQKEAASILGLDAQLLNRLDLIKPIHFTVRPHTLPRFDRREVDAFLSKIQGKSPTINKLPKNCVTLTRVGKIGVGHVGEVCSMIIAGIITPRGLLKGAVGLAAVLVDYSELRMIARSKAALPYSMNDIVRRLNLSRNVVLSLIKTACWMPFGSAAVTRSVKRQFGGSNRNLSQLRH